MDRLSCCGAAAAEPGAPRRPPAAGPSRPLPPAPAPQPDPRRQGAQGPVRASQLRCDRGAERRAQVPPTRPEGPGCRGSPGARVPARPSRCPSSRGQSRDRAGRSRPPEGPARPAPPPGSGAGRAVHILSQSPLLGPAADVAAQESHRGLVLDRLLLHGLDLQRPALLWGPAEGGGPGVGHGLRRDPGLEGSQPGPCLQSRLRWGRGPRRSAALSSGEQLGSSLSLVPSSFGVDDVPISVEPPSFSPHPGPLHGRRLCGLLPAVWEVRGGLTTRPFALGCPCVKRSPAAGVAQ